MSSGDAMKLAIALALLTSGPAYGIDLQDSMRNWKNESVEAKAQLLKNVLLDRGPVERSRMMFCMDQSANARIVLPKHVSEMIEFCLKDND
jgi:hypothetical protein